MPILSTNLRSKAMKRYYAVIGKIKEGHRQEDLHFNEESAREAVARIRYTDKAGAEKEGAHWTPEQVKAATAGMKFPEGTTEWDKYVALNSFYADLCGLLDEPQILKAAVRFYFEDGDAPEGKIKRYIDAMAE